MSPEAHGGDLRGGPCGLVDPETVAAVLDLVAARRLHVERGHPVVGVPAERLRDRHAVLRAAVETATHLVDRLHLEHEVGQPAGVMWGEREAVMAWVAAQELQRTALEDHL